MAGYLMRYKGIYRLKAHYDLNTNDFPRDITGCIDSDDIYIKCLAGAQIYHYGYTTLVAYIPSIGRGHNILKALGERLCGITKEEGYIWTAADYKNLYHTLITDSKVIRGVMENDSEIEFKFNAKFIDLIAEYLKPLTSGASISPFSTKNLPKSSYVIPVEDLQEYKDLAALVEQKDMFVIKCITNDFITKIIAKKPMYKGKNLKAEMRKLVLKPKEFIHHEGFWKQYIDYFKEELNKLEKKS